jgi:hypothetical protein
MSEMQIENAIALFTMGVGVFVLLIRKCPLILGPLLIGVGGYLWWTERERHEEEGKETLSADEIPWWVWAGVGVAAFFTLMFIVFSFTSPPGEAPIRTYPTRIYERFGQVRQPQYPPVATPYQIQIPAEKIHYYKYPEIVLQSLAALDKHKVVPTAEGYHNIYNPQGLLMQVRPKT